MSQTESPDLKFKVSIDAQQCKNAGKPLFYVQIASQLRHLEGNVLTVVDAAFNDREQRKAVKDLMRGHINRQIVEIEKACLSVDWSPGPPDPR